MNIYAVMRYGNDLDGPDGADTEYLVLSDTVEHAAEIVDDDLKKSLCTKVKSFSHAISMIGNSKSEFEKTIILLGPYLTDNSKLDIGVPETLIWKRCEETGRGPWRLLEEF